MTFQPWIRRRQPSPKPRPLTFNGAMTFQPWIRVSAWPVSDRSSAFNGAMTFQPWILVVPGGLLFNRVGLQWSHDLSAMDT